ncbi:response regulator [Sulfitobacter pseudonitzschiae]|uniref:Response regulator n=1 Tax=Pseudosulfitobacter pseudonitzschiae TaxID=1402135 RepID=A0A9Q2RUT3_9RHOB|nr:response regulator [Pseudosulfitobacter pseudonitzschiae]MBM2292297.1 response regulator [Pseudosulfitobacter pseudonitzschiae]MBM2297215.1 response regulator [Pseudosulfitobacter pseudonitzschiae]MBM2302129.1 response regulator [Pseudosulfitobacter pseudonitzschiae]MBM2311911.1 response regulator [Pseudosulfitobacter pseudonitzschiae]MBM2316825.1 response regulator [Pseudosulfitobacter pseudonitzschiae]
MKILAVDDNQLTLDLLSQLTGQLGFHDVTTASSGEDALELIGRDAAPFDCLLFDIMMTGMNGIELCSLVRALPAYQHTPIIMLTSMTDRDYVDRAFKAGATDYANKPFHISELGARLRIAKQIRDAHSAHTSQNPLAIDAKQSLSQSFTITGFPGLISYDALGNYLLQLSQAGLAGSQVEAVKIHRIDTIHTRTSSDEFSYALGEVADAISSALMTQNAMMAYAGNGAFLIVRGRTGMMSSVDLETEIQNLLDDKGTEYDNGDPLDLDISIGNPILPRLNATRPARDVFERALARAEQRMAQQTGHATTLQA